MLQLPQADHAFEVIRILRPDARDDTSYSLQLRLVGTTQHPADVSKILKSPG
jgi:hypothetical protein